MSKADEMDYTEELKEKIRINVYMQNCETQCKPQILLKMEQRSDIDA